MRCRLCPAYKVHVAESHKQRYARHEKSRSHIFKAGEPTSTKKDDLTKAPSKEQFQEVINAVLSGCSASAIVGCKIGRRKKVQRMRACAAESRRRTRRIFIKRLRKPGNICMQRDDSKQKTIFFFTAVNNTLDVQEGLLDWSSHVVSDSIMKTENLRQSFIRFSTPRAGYCKAGKMDKTSFDKLTNLTKFMTTDAAAPELMAIKMQKHGTKLDGVNPVTPHLDYHVRDKAHSTKRVLQRPFEACPVMKGIIDRFVLNEHTFLSIVHYSAEFSSVFKRACVACGLTYTPIALAKHRFSCLQKAFTSITYALHALQDTAVYIVSTRERSSTAVKMAVQFLEESDDDLALIGAMAEAVEEVPLMSLSLIRCAEVYPNIFFRTLRG